VTSNRPRLHEIKPAHAVPGGRIAIFGEGFDPSRAHDHRVYFGDKRAQLMRVSSDTVTAIVPESAMPEVRVEFGGSASAPLPVAIASVIAEELQPVANPVYDSEGRLYVTLSGSRGEKVPVSIFCIEPDGEIRPFASDIVNATGLAFGPDGYLYVSSREEGTVYRVSSEREVELVADELGVATGIAFDADGILYVGDRRGTIFRIEPNGEPRSFCHLEPSVSAYHLIFDGDGDLLVTGPSLSSVDGIYRIHRTGNVELFVTGFGRPQGMAFDAEANLYVTEGLAGDSGVYRVSPDGSAEKAIAAPPLVGLAFDGRGGVALAGASTVFQLDWRA
jgi:hypothetical protein